MFSKDIPFLSNQPSAVARLSMYATELGLGTVQSKIEFLS